MQHRILILATVTAALVACSNASSGAPAEGNFASTVDGTKYVGSPMVYFPRNTAVIQDGDNGKLLVIRLVALETAHPEHTTFAWTFYLPVKTGHYTVTHDTEDSCNCHMTLENSNFLQYSPGTLNVEVQTLNAKHVVATFSGILTLRDEYRVGHPEAKKQLLLTDGSLDVPMSGPP